MVQWYPGHMEKTRRQMQEHLKAVDAVIEIRDARIPRASANPVLDQLAAGKPRLIILGKADMADPVETDRWKKRLTDGSQIAIAGDLQHADRVKKEVVAAMEELTKDMRERQIRKGIRPRAVRAMVCGIPNVGKSTFINRIARRNIARTEDRPGVTRSLTWIHTDHKLDLLDTPGVLWPKFEDERTGSLLAIVGSVNDQILDLNMIAMDAIHILTDMYPQLLKDAYEVEPEMTPPKVLDRIAFVLNLKKENDRPDRSRAAISFLKDLRKGKLGRITLERADEKPEAVSE